MVMRMVMQIKEIKMVFIMEMETREIRMEMPMGTIIQEIKMVKIMEITTKEI